MVDQKEIRESRPAHQQFGPPKSPVREFFEQGLITVIMALFLMTFIAQAVAVPTGSMQYTMNIGDHLFVNKFIFGKPTPDLAAAADSPNQARRHYRLQVAKRSEDQLRQARDRIARRYGSG